MLKKLNISYKIALYVIIFAGIITYLSVSILISVGRTVDLDIEVFVDDIYDCREHIDDMELNFGKCEVLQSKIMLTEGEVNELSTKQANIINEIGQSIEEMIQMSESNDTLYKNTISSFSEKAMIEDIEELNEFFYTWKQGMEEQVADAEQENKS